MQKLILLICFFMTTTVAFSQEKAAVPAQDNPLSTFNKRAYGQMKDWLLRSAEKVPEQHYNFRPTEAVRSFGQIVGHVADVQYMFCSLARGEKNPGLKIEQTKTTKADLIAALKDAFVYCDQAYDSMTDASGIQMVKLARSDTPKLSVLTVNLSHSALHYGNLVTYMRLKNIVPPSSER
jgi:uncharacterized damage-inducible protein DinB